MAYYTPNGKVTGWSNHIMRFVRHIRFFLPDALRPRFGIMRREMPKWWIKEKYDEYGSKR